MNRITVTRIAESDRAALKEIYQTISGGDVELNEKYWVRKDEKHFRQRCNIRGGQGLALYAGAKTDQKGRITYLSLHVKNPFSNPMFDLPVAIGKLEKLEELFLFGCGSLPESLSELPNLKTLILGSSRQIFQHDSVWEIKLPQLNFLHIYGSLRSRDFQVPLPVFFPWIQENLPSLQSLHLQGAGRCESKAWHPPDFRKGSRPHNCLRRVTLPFWDIDEKLLEFLMFDVLPSFPMVSKLNLSHNKISSLRSIHERLKHTTIAPRPTLLMLDSNYNPLVNMTQIEELCAFLRAFNVFLPPNVSRRNWFLDKHPDVQRELVLNMAGRSLLSDENLPLSMWPTILARVNLLEERDDRFDAGATATGMYCLLRNTSLLDRRTWKEST